MKITDLRVVPISAPVPPERQWRTDLGTKVKSDSTVVIVETDEGITGLGCAQGSPLVMKATIEAELKPLLIGEDPTWVEYLWEKMYSGNRAEPAIARGYSQPVMGRRGETLAAIAGVDIALWDIFGKAAGQPVYKLLGACRRSIRAYASGGWAPGARAGEELAGYVAKGFGAVKMRVEGIDGFSLDKCETRVRAVREAVGWDVEIMVDAHGSLSVPMALKVAERLRPYNLTWFEEPVSPDNRAGMAEVRARGGVPIAAGESEFTRWDFRDLIAAEAIDYLQPDVAIAGGITECRRIGTLASTHGKLFAPHVWSSAILFAAGLHLAASVPATAIFEVSQGAIPLIHELTTEPFDIRDGWVHVSDKPGLGIDVIPDYEKRFAYVPGPQYVY